MGDSREESLARHRASWLHRLALSDSLFLVAFLGFFVSLLACLMHSPSGRAFGSGASIPIWLDQSGGVAIGNADTRQTTFLGYVRYRQALNSLAGPRLVRNAVKRCEVSFAFEPNARITASEAQQAEAVALVRRYLILQEAAEPAPDPMMLALLQSNQTVMRRFQLQSIWRIVTLLACFLSGSLTFALLVQALRINLRRGHGMCTNCGYDIRNIRTGPCPECGYAQAR